MTVFSIIEINPNLRFADGETVVGPEDVTGAVPEPGELVAVCERWSGLSGRGWVKDVDDASGEITLVVDWANLRTSTSLTSTVPPSHVEENRFIGQQAHAPAR